jgi:hypothetical protein
MTSMLSGPSLPGAELTTLKTLEPVEKTKPSEYLTTTRLAWDGTWRRAPQVSWARIKPGTFPKKMKRTTNRTRMREA